MSANEAKPPALNARDRQLAALLASGRTQAEAATELSLSRATVQRMAVKTGFKELVSEIRGQSAAATEGALLEGSRAVVDELRRLATGAESEAVRVSAARAILEFSVRFRIDDLAAEIEAIRARVDARNNPPSPVTGAALASIPRPTAPTPSPETTETTGPLMDDTGSLFG